MRAIREILRRRFDFEQSIRQISRDVGSSYGAVQNLITRAKAAGLTWPLSEELDDGALEQLLYKQPETSEPHAPMDMEAIDKEMRHKGVTLMLLWQEYKGSHPDGYQYSAFCERFRAWKRIQEPTMRQTHRAGEKLFIDFAGMTVPFVDGHTGEKLEAHIFVASMGARSYVFAHAFMREDLKAWALGLCFAFEHLGGVPELVVPDNPKAAVLQPSRYEPVLNATFLETVQHYGTAASPARPKKPRDKAKVESAVQVVERRVLAPLRHRQFFSLEEVQEAVARGVSALNRRPFQKREGCRLSLFRDVDKPALRPLPPTRYDFATWTRAKVNLDYHVEVEKSLYSVPYGLIHQKVWVRVGSQTVQIYHQNRRVANHVRAYQPGSISTCPDHMPSSHRRHAEWSPSRIIQWAQQTGPKTALLVETIMRDRPHPEMGFRSCIGIIRLGKKYGNERLEAAAGRALAIGTTSYRSIKSILDNGLDAVALQKQSDSADHPVHENIRGQTYFTEGEAK